MERDSRLDWLRAIGIMLVILAHSQPPFILKNIRCFDVCLLFFVSGCSFEISNNFKNHSLGNLYYYFLKRIKKLVVPAWFLVTIIYLGTSTLCFLTKSDYMYSFEDYIFSMFFTNKGIGYVWIVKLFLIIAIILPLYSFYSSDFSNTKHTIVCLIIIISYAILHYTYMKEFKGRINENIQILIDEFIMCPIAYSLIAIIGLVIKRNHKNSYIILTISGLCFIMFQIINISDGFSPNNSKWPPDLYYLSYGLMASLILFLSIPNRKVKTIEWISRNSYNIYLCHIPFIILLMICRSDRLRILPSLFNNCYFCYFFLLISGIGTTIVLEKVKKIIGYGRQ